MGNNNGSLLQHHRPWENQPTEPAIVRPWEHEPSYYVRPWEHVPSYYVRPWEDKPEEPARRAIRPSIDMDFEPIILQPNIVAVGPVVPEQNSTQQDVDPSSPDEEHPSADPSIPVDEHPSTDDSSPEEEHPPTDPSIPVEENPSADTSLPVEERPSSPSTSAGAEPAAAAAAAGAEASDDEADSDPNSILFAWFEANIDCPYASKSIAADLAQRTKFTKESVYKWISNRRTRSGCAKSTVGRRKKTEYNRAKPYDPSMRPMKRRKH